MKDRGERKLIVGRIRQLFPNRPHGAVVKPDFKRDRRPGDPLAAAPPPHLCSHGGNRGIDINAFRKRLGERGLARNGFHWRGYAGGRLVATDCPRIHDQSVFAEQPLEPRRPRLDELPKRFDPLRLQRLLGGLADPAHRANRQRREEIALRPGKHHGDAARLVHVGCDFRDRLRCADADRAGDAQILHPSLDSTRDGERMLSIRARRRDIQERLIDAHLLDNGRLFAKDAHNGVADRAITTESARRPDGIRA